MQNGSLLAVHPKIHELSPQDARSQIGLMVAELRWRLQLLRFIQCFYKAFPMLARLGSTACIEPRNMAGFWKPSTQPMGPLCFNPVHTSLPRSIEAWTFTSLLQTWQETHKQTKVLYPSRQFITGELQWLKFSQRCLLYNGSSGLKSIENTISANYGDVAYLYQPL
jgi:hypothetical protein